MTSYICFVIFFALYEKRNLQKKTKKVSQLRHKNEELGEEEWEIKPLKQRWIIPRFHDVTC